MSRFLSLLVLFAPVLAQAGELGIGRAATQAEIAAWDIDVRPDGTGLPKGHGSVLRGEEVFNDLCVHCHGDFGEGVGRYPALAGGEDTLTHERPLKTVGSYWPYLSTVFDYVRRAQPFGSPGTLSDEDVYAVAAYILYLNDLVREDFTLNATSFKEVALPNAKGYISDTRSEEPPAKICMTDCGAPRKITRRASDLKLDEN